jgi:YVTN family beta-propeller protein
MSGVIAGSRLYVWRIAVGLAALVAGCSSAPAVFHTSAASELGRPTATASPRAIEAARQPFRVLAAIDLGDQLPWQVAVDDESVWVLVRGTDRSTVLRINPVTNRLSGRPIEIDMNAWDLETLAGALWVGGWRGPEQAMPVMRIDPQSGQTRLIGGSTGFLGPYLAAGFGSIWTADSDERTSADTVTRIDPTRSVVSARIRVGRSPQSIAVGEHNVWTGNHDDGSLSRIDPRTNRVTATVALEDRPGSRRGAAHGLAVGDGYAFAMMSHEGLIVPIAATQARANSPINPGFAALDGVVADHILWAGESVFNSEGQRVVLIDPVTLTTIGVGSVGARCCYGIAAGFDSVWTATRYPNRLVRLVADRSR